MGKKKDFTEDKKNQIIKYMSENLSTIEIAKIINRYHPTGKNFYKEVLAKWKRLDKGEISGSFSKNIHKIKKEVSINPHATSKAIFEAANAEKCVERQDAVYWKRLERWNHNWNRLINPKPQG